MAGRVSLQTYAGHIAWFLRVWGDRPASMRLCVDMVILVLICEQHGLGLENYSRTLMTEELHDLVMSVGHRWGARLRRANGIKIMRTQKYKAVTEGNHALNIAPGLLDQDFSAPG
jgi:putative transposase